MNKEWRIFEGCNGKIIYPRGSGRYPAMIVFDEFEYDSEMEHFCRWILKKQLRRPLDYTVGGYGMHNDKEELMKELIKRRANDELEPDIMAAPLWDGMIA